MIYFSTEEYFAKMLSLGYVPSLQTQDNAQDFLRKLNPFLRYLIQQRFLPVDYPFILKSGWRSSAFNEKTGGEKNNAFVEGKAIEIEKCDVVRVCEKDPSLLEKFYLYAESSIDTPTLSYLTDRVPASTHRIFRA